MTIRQLADECGVTRQAIDKIIDRLDMRGQLTKEGSAYVLTDDQADQIRQYRQRNRTATSATAPQPEAQPDATGENGSIPESATATCNHVQLQPVAELQPEVAAVLEVLQKELEEKNRLISDLTAENRALIEANSSLTESNARLTEALTNAQALHAGTMKQQLEQGHNDQEQERDDQNQDDPEGSGTGKEKPGLLERIKRFLFES